MWGLAIACFEIFSYKLLLEKYISHPVGGISPNFWYGGSNTPL